MIEAHEPEYLSVAEAARQLQVSHPTVWRWIKSGRLPAYRVGPKTIRIKKDDLARLVRPVSLPVSEMSGAASMETGTDRRPLTEEERERGLAVMRELDAFREQLLTRRGGVPFPSSVGLIHEMRDERSRHLDEL